MSSTFNPLEMDASVVQVSSEGGGASSDPSPPLLVEIPTVGGSSTLGGGNLVVDSRQMTADVLVDLTDDGPMDGGKDVAAETSTSGVVVEGPSTGSERYSFKCVFCEQLLQPVDEPKLLQCLHNVCATCLNARLADQQDNSSKGGGIECPQCVITCDPLKIIDNQFVMETSSVEEAIRTAELKCSSCSDDASATSWCVECSEYICDNCVQAHQRLKITKDHTIKSKEDSSPMENNTSATANQTSIMCSVHPHEKLSVFCETCDKLTCRDCQLIEHREHKYQFTNEIASETRKMISNMLKDVGYKRVLLNSAMKVIDDRQVMIADKKQALVKEITSLVVKVTNAINIRGKQLIAKLTDVCDSKQKTLNDKKHALGQLSRMTDYCISFTQHALDNGSDMALLYSKRQFTDHLKRIRSRRADIPNPEVPVRIYLNVDKVAELINAVSCMGQVIVDGRAATATPTASVNSVVTGPVVGSAAAAAVPTNPSVVIDGYNSTIHYPPQECSPTNNVPTVLPSPAPPLQQQQPQQHQNRIPIGYNQQQQQQQMGKMAPPPYNSPHIPIGNYPFGQPQQQQPQQPGKGSSMVPSPQGQQHQSFAQANLHNRSQQQMVAGNRVIRQQVQGSQIVQQQQQLPPLQARIMVANMGQQQPMTNSVMQHHQQVSSSTHPQGVTGKDHNSLRGLLQNSNSAMYALQVQQQQQQQHHHQQQQQQQQQQYSGQQHHMQQQHIQQQQRLSSQSQHHHQQQQPQPVYQVTQAAVNSVRLLIQQNQQRQQHHHHQQHQQHQQHHHQQQQHQQQQQRIPPRTTLYQTYGGLAKWHIPQNLADTNGSQTIEKTTNSTANCMPTINDNFKITLKQQQQQPANSNNNNSSSSNQSVNTTAVSSTIPKTPSPNHVQRTANERRLDKVCDDSVNDLMATIAKLDSNGVQVVAEGGGHHSNSGDGVAGVLNSVTTNSLPASVVSSNAVKQTSETSSPHLVDSSTDNNRNGALNNVTKLLKNAVAADASDKEDPNEDWCAVCMDGGELVCCDKCPKVFHQYCHIPNLSVEENDTWQCLLCTNFADRSTHALNERKAGEMSAREQKIAERLILELYCQYDVSLPFREVVPDDDADYHSVIKHPISLDMIRQRVMWDMPGHYTAMDQLIGDVKVMFKNAFTYYPTNSLVYSDGKYLENFFIEQLDKLLPHTSYDDLEPPTKRHRRTATD